MQANDADRLKLRCYGVIAIKKTRSYGNIGDRIVLELVHNKNLWLFWYGGRKKEKSVLYVFVFKVL